MGAIRRFLDHGPVRGVGTVLALALAVCAVGAAILAALSSVMA